MKIKYLATYNGPSYGTYGGYGDYFEGFASIQAAKDELDRRQRMEYGYTTTYAENNDDLFVIWESEKRYAFPGTTKDDSMELYAVSDAGQMQYLRDTNPSYRLTVGPRGGIQVEAY